MWCKVKIEQKIFFSNIFLVGYQRSCVFIFSAKKKLAVTVRIKANKER